MGAVLVALLAVPLTVVLVSSKWGVLIGVLLAAGVGAALWVRQRGVAFIELAAFLIHFDGLGMGQIRVGRIIAASAAVLILYKLIVERWRPPAVPPRSWIPVLGFVIWATASGAWSNKFSTWLFSVGLLLLGVAYFALSGFLVDSHDKVERFLRAFWYGGLCGAFAGVVGLLLGKRSWGLMGDQNYFGLTMAMMVPLTIYYRRQQTTPRGRFVYTFVVLFVFAGAAGAGSRSGIIGVSIATFATLVTRPGLSGGRRARTAVWAFLLAAVSFLVLFVANPSNLSRGLSDRGAGRLDFWTTAMDMLDERPVTGRGGGQMSVEMPLRLPTTEGVRELTESRETVSTHNTWIDVMGDYGAIGLLTYASIFVVTLFNLARPRWKRYRQLSTTLFVMMLPVVTSSNLVPMLNSKLTWSLAGLAAALQVPSWGARWAGYFSSRPDSRKLAILERAEGDGARSADAAPEWTATTLARWDLRVSRRFRYYLAIGGFAGFVLFGVVASGVPVTYSAEVDLLVPVLDAPAGSKSIHIDRDSVQTMHTLLLSDAYAIQLKELSGVDLSVSQIRARMDVLRPKFGAFMKVSFDDTDESTVAQVGPHIVEAFRALIAQGRAVSAATLAEEVRPMYPGEQRFYQGDLFLPVSETPSFSSDPPPVGTASFVGGITGVLVAAGLMLLQQRRPRVNSDDDFPSAVGMPLLTHVGRVGRRYAATRAQYSHVALSALEATGGSRIPRRILIAGPLSDGADRGLAMGVAAALAAGGERVVLVDGQVDRPWLSVRLGGWRRRGISDVGRGEVDLASTVRFVRRWRLPTSVRRALGRSGGNIRFIPAGRRRGSDAGLDPAVLDRLDDNVITVLLAPPLLGAVPVAPSLRWADVVLYCLVEGRTVTFDAEDAAVRIRTFSTGAAGVVLSDV